MFSSAPTGRALAPLTRRIAYLHDGDWTLVDRHGAKFFDVSGSEIQREVKLTRLTSAAVGKGNFRHFMEKELHEHPQVIGDTLHRMVDTATRAVVLPPLPFDFAAVPRLTMSACGSAFYAGLVGRWWFEAMARIPTDGDVASEFRYRAPPLPMGGLGLLVSQSGETADTLAALRYMREQGQHVLSILNVPESSMARESDAVLETVAGPEIGVASTKAFYRATVGVGVSGAGGGPCLWDHQRGGRSCDDRRAAGRCRAARQRCWRTTRRSRRWRNAWR